MPPRLTGRALSEHRFESRYIALFILGRSWTIGGPTRIRTWDRRIMSPLLYR